VLEEDDWGNISHKVRHNTHLYLAKQFPLHSLSPPSLKHLLNQLTLYKSVKHVNVQAIRESFQYKEEVLCLVGEFCGGGTLEKELSVRHES
jgi:hypothetical protein